MGSQVIVLEDYIAGCLCSIFEQRWKMKSVFSFADSSHMMEIRTVLLKLWSLDQKLQLQRKDG